MVAHAGSYFASIYSQSKCQFPGTPDKAVRTTGWYIVRARAVQHDTLKMNLLHIEQA